jgi:cytochrome c oxidase cbb3-type subunit 3
MKFINYLESIAGVGIFPLISLFIFFIFFLLLIIWAFRVKKDYIVVMKNIPFEDTDQKENNLIQLAKIQNT